MQAIKLKLLEFTAIVDITHRKIFYKSIILLTLIKLRSFFQIN